MQKVGERDEVPRAKSHTPTPNISDARLYGKRPKGRDAQRRNRTTDMAIATVGYRLVGSLDDRQGFELAISPTGIFAGHLTSILSTGSTEVRRKKPIRERFWSTRPIDQY